ncbi:hypothetical protein HanPSC8_Chr07g0288601 [Helianthus annuus]|nr:hypothetical protein HanPSC8_Chr07g0288601 [Helianthus annuus]
MQKVSPSSPTHLKPIVRNNTHLFSYLYCTFSLYSIPTAACHLHSFGRIFFLIKLFSFSF